LLGGTTLHAAGRVGAKQSKRVPVLPSTQSALLIANRHACCICQKARVQIHHIDGDPSNNDLANLATLCTDHHDLASMQIGLTKKLQPDEVTRYKTTWEERCREDLLALAKDRVGYYVTLYKNPPRIRELFSSLSAAERHTAVESLLKTIAEEDRLKAADAAYQFQLTPKKDNRTHACLASAALGEFWPSWLPRVGGHPEDPDLPIDLGPPNGMEAFHCFDLYCQILVRVLMVLKPPVPLEYIREFIDPEELKPLEGRLVSFREAAIGKRIESPKVHHTHRTGTVQFRNKRRTFLYLTNMTLRNMYVFSDTSADNLRESRVCGIGVFGGAILNGKGASKEMRLRVVPLLIGLGGLGQSDASGWSWNLN